MITTTTPRVSERHSHTLVMAKKKKVKTARQQCKHGNTPRALATDKDVGHVTASKCHPNKASYKVTKQWRLVKTKPASAPTSPSGGGFRKKKKKRNPKGSGWFHHGMAFL